MAYKYKYIYRVGVFKTAALVVIGHRITEGDKSGDYFSAFNYDMRTGAKSAIEDADVLSEWKFIKLAQFQPSVTPDVTLHEHNPDRLRRNQGARRAVPGVDRQLFMQAQKLMTSSRLVWCIQ